MIVSVLESEHSRQMGSKRKAFKAKTIYTLKTRRQHTFYREELNAEPSVRPCTAGTPEVKTSPRTCVFAQMLCGWGWFSWVSLLPSSPLKALFKEL